MELRFCVIFILGSIVIFVTQNYGGYVFQKEVTVKSLSLVPTDEYPASLLEDSYIAALSLEKRRMVCAEACKYVSLPFFLEYQYIFEGHVYEVEYWNGLQRTTVAIKCPTYPAMHLCSGKMENEIKVLVISPVPPSIDEKLVKYIFDVELVKRIPPFAGLTQNAKSPDTASIIEQKFQKNLLFTLDPEDRFNLCFDAARRIRRKIGFAKNIIDLPSVQSVDYRISNGGNSTVKHVVINCETTPAIYLRSKIPKVTGRIEIKIILSDIDALVRSNQD